jgi:tetratricopeptide (TPR) repeat protein
MLEKFSEAIAQYEQALAKDQTFWPAVNNIGLIEYERGDIETAIAKWQTAIDIDPEAAEPQLAVAVAWWARGQQERGLRIGEAALRLDPRYGDLEFLKENLWGDRLIADTKKFFQTPRIQAMLAQSGVSAPNSNFP